MSYNTHNTEPSSTNPAVKQDRILIVDDEESIRSILSRYLAMKGYHVTTASDGMSAIDQLKEEPYDLVLTDLKMPNLDGRELLKLMSDQFPDIPKIVLSGYGTNEDILLALKTGAYDFLNKPIIDFKILDHAIERALDRKHLAEQRDHYIEQLTQINDVISLLNRGRDTEKVFKTLSMLLRKIIPFNRISLALIDQETGEVVTKLVDSDKDIMIPAGSRFPLKDSSLNEAASSRKVLIISDLKEYGKEHPQSEKAELLVKEGMNSSMVLPLIVNNNTRGFLFFGSEQPGAFSEEHITFIESISAPIAFSIQRSELMNELEMYTKKLENLVKIRTHEVLKTQKTTIFALSSLAELRDPDTGEHLERMRNYCILIAQIAKYSGKNVEINNQYLRDLYDSSILHDIGKVGIPDDILLKPGPLSPEEFEIIKTHTTIGHQSLHKAASRELGDDSFLKMAMDVTLYHHERWDGGGYPEGLKGEEIPLSARIVAVTDVYDALTSRRPYKEAFSHEKSVEIMLKESYRFDPDLFKIFLDNHEEFNNIRKEFN